MQTHILTITHSGLLADYGVMDAVLAERVMRGARRLLSANAYYYTQGYVPVRLLSRTRDFQIVEWAPEHGSLTRELLVAVGGSAIYDVAKVHFPEVLLVAVALSAVGLMSVKKKRWIEVGRRIKDLGREDQPTRIEPVLPVPSYDRPMHTEERIVPENPREENRGSGRAPERDLVSESSKAIEDLIYPAEHRGALRVEVRLDGDLIVSIAVERDVLTPARRDVEEQIAAAVGSIRTRRSQRSC